MEKESSTEKVKNATLRPKVDLENFALHKTDEGFKMRACKTFFHHYQGSIDFNTVNIHRTVGMYFLVSTGFRDDIE